MYVYIYIYIYIYVYLNEQENFERLILCGNGIT